MIDGLMTEQLGWQAWLERHGLGFWKCHFGLVGMYLEMASVFLMLCAMLTLCVCAVLDLTGATGSGIIWLSFGAHLIHIDPIFESNMANWWLRRAESLATLELAMTNGYLATISVFVFCISADLLRHYSEARQGICFKTTHDRQIVRNPTRLFLTSR
jgi:hypothetical protein